MTRRTQHPTGPGNGPQKRSQRPPTATPGTRSRRTPIARPATGTGGSDQLEAGGADPLLTIAEVCAELGVARSTYYEWRTKKRGPQEIQLPNREYRIRRSALDAWLKARIVRGK